MIQKVLPPDPSVSGWHWFATDPLATHARIAGAGG
jgi:hypothetical protein